MGIFDEILPEKDDTQNDVQFGPDVKKNYVVIGLDRSGSMMAMKQQAIEFFNSQVTEAQNTRGMINRICLITFASEAKIEMWDVGVDEIVLLDETTYSPDGWTAMLDAVGVGITNLLKQPDINDENVSVLFTIISDGQENYSKEYTHNAVKELILEVTKTGRWTFTYLGSNQDLSVVKDMGISEGNIRAFTATAAGLAAAGESYTACAGSYFESRTMGMRGSSSFFSPPADPVQDTPTYINPGPGAAWGGKEDDKKKTKSKKKTIA